jgi:hypothetical protein
MASRVLGGVYSDAAVRNIRLPLVGYVYPDVEIALGAPERC